MRLKGFLCAAALLSALFLCPAACAENRALLVGCDSFLSRSDTRPSSANNVAEMAEALSGGSMNLDELITRRDGISGAAELAELIGETFAPAREGDVSYLYLSTHGLWEPGEPGSSMTLLLSDGRSENGMTAQQLHDAFDGVQGTKVLIIDACHAGAMIAKGIRDEFGHIFEGGEFKLICSAGGAEESWFWKGPEGEAIAGGGYFSGILSAGMSVRTGYAADANRDGVITLSEMAAYLDDMHGASRVQTYPEEDEFALLTYDAESVRRQTEAVGHILFEDGMLDRSSPSLAFSFTVFQPCRVAYQLVQQKGSRWDFEHARLVYDTGELFGSFGDAEGYLSPGFKERTIDLREDTLTRGGYLLFQMIVTEQDRVHIVASRALALSRDDPLTEIVISQRNGFSPERGEEMGFVITHAGPVQLTCVIENAAGESIRRLCSRMPSRPEQIYPEGTTLYWDGRDQKGEAAVPGAYRLRVTVRRGGEEVTVTGASFYLTGGNG